MGNVCKCDTPFQEATAMRGLSTKKKKHSLLEKVDKSTINLSGRERMVVLDQHIKFLEGNYSATSAVSWERQTWGHDGAVGGEGRREESQSNLAILNILRHIIMVWFGEKMDRSGTGWVCVRDFCPTSCVSDYYTAIISGLSLSLSLPQSLLHPSLSFPR